MKKNILLLLLCVITTTVSAEIITFDVSKIIKFLPICQEVIEIDLSSYDFLEAENPETGFIKWGSTWWWIIVLLLGLFVLIIVLSILFARNENKKESTKKLLRRTPIILGVLGIIFIGLVVIINIRSANRNLEILESLSNSVFIYEDGKTLSFNSINKKDSTYTARYNSMYNMVFKIIYSSDGNPMLIQRKSDGFSVGRIEIINETTLSELSPFADDETIKIIRRQTEEDIKKAREDMKNDIAKYVNINYAQLYKVSIVNKSDFTIDEIVFKSASISEIDYLSKYVIIDETSEYDKLKYTNQDTIYYLGAHTSQIIGKSIEVEIISIKCKSLGIN